MRLEKSENRRPLWVAAWATIELRGRKGGVGLWVRHGQGRPGHTDGDVVVVGPTGRAHAEDHNNTNSYLSCSQIFFLSLLWYCYCTAPVKNSSPCRHYVKICAADKAMI
jgi:hypothetical protein